MFEVYSNIILSFLGVTFSLEAVISKWKKLRQQYKSNLDKSRRGTERRKKWKFFDKMDQACGSRDTSTPVSLVDSSLILDSSVKKPFIIMSAV